MLLKKKNESFIAPILSFPAYCQERNPERIGTIERVCLNLDEVAIVRAETTVFMEHVCTDIVVRHRITDAQHVYHCTKSDWSVLKSLEEIGYKIVEVGTDD